MIDNQSSAYEPTALNLSDGWTRAERARRFESPVERVKAATAEVGHTPAKVAEVLGKPWPWDNSRIV